MEAKAATEWDTASRSHLNLDFRLNSQPLAVAFTERPSTGGAAWSNFQFADARFDFAFAMWANSANGLLSHWWHSDRHQHGQSRITIASAETLPILGLRALTDAQLSTAQDIFDDFRYRGLMPAYLADVDPGRAHCDRHVTCELLGFNDSVYKPYATSLPIGAPNPSRMVATPGQQVRRVAGLLSSLPRESGKCLAPSLASGGYRV